VIKRTREARYKKVINGTKRYRLDNCFQVTEHQFYADYTFKHNSRSTKGIPDPSSLSSSSITFNASRSSLSKVTPDTLKFPLESLLRLLDADGSESAEAEP